MRTHPKDGVTQWSPKPGEVIVKAYGNFDGWALRLYLDDAYRIVERDTGKRPAAHFTYDGGVIEVRIADQDPSGSCPGGPQSEDHDPPG